jgi:hypothetical protein
MLVKSPVSAAPSLGAHLNPIGTHDDFLQAVARRYFGDAENCRVVADEDGRMEPLIDEVWDARQRHRDIATTPFAALARMLVQEGVEFICWSASDHDDLPVVHSWPEIEGELLSQTAFQPADFYVHFQPQ